MVSRQDPCEEQEEKRHIFARLLIFYFPIEQKQQKRKFNFLLSHNSITQIAFSVFLLLSSLMFHQVSLNHTDSSCTLLVIYIPSLNVEDM